MPQVPSVDIAWDAVEVEVTCENVVEDDFAIAEDERVVGDGLMDEVLKVLKVLEVPDWTEAELEKLTGKEVEDRIEETDAAFGKEYIVGDDDKSPGVVEDESGGGGIAADDELGSGLVIIEGESGRGSTLVEDKIPSMGGEEMKVWSDTVVDWVELDIGVESEECATFSFDGIDVGGVIFRYPSVEATLLVTGIAKV